MNLASAVEHIAWLVQLFRKGELISDSDRRGCALGDEQVALLEPGGILFIDIPVPFRLFKRGKREIADMFGENGIGLFDETDHIMIKLRIRPSAADGSRKIYFLIHNEPPWIIV